MKILTTMYTMREGGSYERFRMMIEALLERECEVHCLSLTPIRMNHPTYRNHVVFLPVAGGAIAKLIVLFLFPLYSLLIGWREKIELFIAFGPLYAFTTVIAKKILKRRMISFVRLDPVLGAGRKEFPKLLACLHAAVEYIGLVASDRIIASNTHMRDVLRNRIERTKKINVEVLLNNLPSIATGRTDNIPETRSRWGVPPGAKVLVTVGIVSARKNIETLLKAFAAVKIGNLFLLIVGDSIVHSDLQYKIRLIKLSCRLSLGEKVVFTGWLGRENVWKILKASDLFVMPSIREGMPNAMLEALALGLPCIGSNIPGVQDILKHEELMFDPLDNGTLAEKINRFFADDHYSGFIARLCRERSKALTFDWKTRLYEMVSGKIGPSRPSDPLRVIR